MVEATLAPSPVAGPSRPQGGKRNAINAKRYAYPLPIILPLPSSKPSSPPSILSSLVPSFITRPSVEVPMVVGRYDTITRSVWITDPKDVEIIFARGFFGKGSLSRSELNWRGRRMDLLQGGESLLAEQIREKRRRERKQFKIDRAAAMMDAAKTAEAVLTSTLREQARALSSPSSSGVPPLPVDEGPTEEQEEEDVDGTPEEEETATETTGRASPTPSTSTVATSITTATTTTVAAVDLDVTTLTPQTFLVRPTRPDSNSNRNRGRKAWKRRPPPPPAAGAAPAEASAPVEGFSSLPAPAPIATTTPSGGAGAQAAERTGDVDGDEPPEVDEERRELLEDLDELVPEMEHLQLGLEEAWFLSAALGVLKIYDPETDSYPPTTSLLSLFLTPPPSAHPTDPEPAPRGRLWPDDPFLISYAAYHHFRALGWVVKPGIKFCCDWLLYRRGPAFSHSAFSCVLIPVYADPAVQSVSPHGSAPWFEERSSWKWMNTIMRVNALVQKTVILVYVTIPPISSFERRYRGADGSLDVLKNDMRSLLERYPIKEVVLQRFSPARRRD